MQIQKVFLVIIRPLHDFLKKFQLSVEFKKKRSDFIIKNEFFNGKVLSLDGGLEI